MNKNLFTAVLILMSVALIGTVWTQVLWIQNAIVIKEEQFDQNVFDAMKSTILRLQKNTALNDISMGLENNDISANRFVVGKDTFISAVGVIPDLEISDPNLIKDEMKLKLADNNPEMKTALSKMLGDSSVMKMPESGFIFASDDSMFAGLEEKLAQKIDVLGDIFKQLVIELKAGDNLEDRLDISKIDETLRTELLQKGINLKFDFAIFKSPSKDSVGNSKEINAELLKSKYNVRLFPDDVFEKQDALLVHFQGKTNFIYRSLSFMLIGSLVFLIVILLTFAITIYIILKQKKLSQIKSDFINNMTHEFKTPIATISLAADSVSNAKTLKSPENILYFTNIIKQENKRMNAQVEKVLQMALLEKHDLPFVAEPVLGNELILQAINNIQIQVTEKSGEIIPHLEAQNDKILVDREHFLNVIFNLLDNANKYSDEKPHIEVFTESDSRHFIIKVKDCGIGMAKDVQKKIFEKFYRQATGNIHNVKGFGLGLSYVKEIVERFGGKVIVESELNIGSTFTIIIPLENGSK
ncbi:MAG: HAMP domain-containing histidine kinase [Bacteroidales bacterium]|nr:HAMP domain-containing histidine kinase [Bacteroidales bacterium]